MNQRNYKKTKLEKMQ